MEKQTYSELVCEKLIALMEGQALLKDDFVEAMPKALRLVN